MVIGAGGFIRYPGDCSWSRIHCRGALRNPGLCPEEAKVVGKVIGVVSRLSEPWSSPLAEFQEEHAGSKRRAPSDNPAHFPAPKGDRPPSHASAIGLNDSIRPSLEDTHPGSAPVWKAASPKFSEIFRNDNIPVI